MWTCVILVREKRLVKLINVNYVKYMRDHTRHNLITVVYEHSGIIF